MTKIHITREEADAAIKALTAIADEDGAVMGDDAQSVINDSPEGVAFVIAGAETTSIDEAWVAPVDLEVLVDALEEAASGGFTIPTQTA